MNSRELPGISKREQYAVALSFAPVVRMARGRHLL
jgi:hypothetical protein